MTGGDSVRVRDFAVRVAWGMAGYATGLQKDDFQGGGGAIQVVTRHLGSLTRLCS